MKIKQIRDPIFFRINSVDIEAILSNNIYDKGIIIKSLMRMCLINNESILKGNIKQYLRKDLNMKGKSKAVNIHFNEKDSDLVEFLDQPGFSNQATIKLLMRIALLNDSDLIKKAGLIKPESFNKFWEAYGLKNQVSNTDQSKVEEISTDSSSANEHFKKFKNMGKEL